MYIFLLVQFLLFFFKQTLLCSCQFDTATHLVHSRRSCLWGGPFPQNISLIDQRFKISKVPAASEGRLNPNCFEFTKAPTLFDCNHCRLSLSFHVCLVAYKHRYVDTRPHSLMIIISSVPLLEKLAAEFQTEYKELIYHVQLQPPNCSRRYVQSNDRIEGDRINPFDFKEWFGHPCGYPPLYLLYACTLLNILSYAPNVNQRANTPWRHCFIRHIYHALFSKSKWVYPQGEQWAEATTKWDFQNQYGRWWHGD